jgi:hypothetical protein
VYLGEERTYRLWALLRDLLQVILDQSGFSAAQNPDRTQLASAVAGLGPAEMNRSRW